MKNIFFQKKVDRRSRSKMVKFLSEHFRYDVMRSWNGITSYANNVKMNRLGLTAHQLSQAYEFFDVEYWDEIRWPIDEFTSQFDHRFTACTNGRSGGYLVLCESNLELTGHLSYCSCCGQQNFKKVSPVFDDNNTSVIAAEILKSSNSWRPQVYLDQSAIKSLPISDDEKLTLIIRLKTELSNCSLSNACGVCGKPRQNYQQLPKRQVIFNRSIDQHEYFDPEEWSLSRLRERVDLVCAFDELCDDIRSNFIDLIESYQVTEKVIHKPVRVKTLTPIAA